jgi:hypothetical protein
MFQIGTLPIINSAVVKSSDYYETSISGYKKNEFWSIWSMPISKNCVASSAKYGDGLTLHTINNIQDYNLNTAWIPIEKNKSDHQYFEYIFKFPENNSYASPYQFLGICNLFNGNCKSLKTWNENSRVKKILVYYNDIPLCYVNVKDTWHFQSFDISRFFINRRYNKNLNADFEIKNGDKLRFEIVETYKGTKYDEVAISEFLCEGAGN